jgi:hypothetical protein
VVAVKHGRIFLFITTHFMKLFFSGVVAIIVVAVAVYVMSTYQPNVSTSEPAGPEVISEPIVETPTESTPGYQNTSYVIEGEQVTLVDGVSEVQAVPGSASLVTTEYFGNEFFIDLDNDGDEDVVFLITQNPGGSGTFFYVVAALSTSAGYVGSDGYRLGDRIAPQSITSSANPRHKDVVVVNFADRAPQDTMVVPPSVGKSVYLKLDTVAMQWGIVESNFEGESR